MPTDRFNELAELAADRFGFVTLADTRAVGYRDSSVAEMARRGRLERVSQGVYRIPFMPGGQLAPYMEAALWPVGVQGALSHETALDLWEVSDVNPAKIHITVPSAHRTQREVPASYVVHRENLDAGEVSEIEGVPVVTLERAIRDCAADGVGLDLIEQAVRNGRDRGLLTADQAAALTADLGLDRIPAQRA
jgi:predicted transcriptional regulator of viral defense system